MKQNVTVNHVGEKVFLTKAFAKKASVLGSTEYGELVRLRQECPNYEFVIREITKNSKKKTYSRLTYKKMREYISQVYGKDSAALREYEQILKLSKTQSGCYAYVRKWFLGAFPNYDVTPEWNDVTDDEATSSSVQAEERVA